MIHLYMVYHNSCSFFPTVDSSSNPVFTDPESGRIDHIHIQDTFSLLHNHPTRFMARDYSQIAFRTCFVHLWSIDRAEIAPAKCRCACLDEDLSVPWRWNGDSADGDLLGTREIDSCESSSIDEHTPGSRKCP